MSGDKLHEGMVSSRPKRQTVTSVSKEYTGAFLRGGFRAKTAK